MAGRAKRRRLGNCPEIKGDKISVPMSFPNNPLVPATNSDRDNWNGFCEIESEPVSDFHHLRNKACSLSQALFNVMLREFGVKGVKVQEVVSLDEEMMAFLPYVPHTTVSQSLINGYFGRRQETCLWLNLFIPMARG
jgi:Ubiquitin carboxyl-terminal hydrolase, family 1